MTPAEINRAIAEICGWTKFHTWDNSLWGFPPGQSASEPVLDYYYDLNAMHEAEKVLIDHTGYWQWIERIQGGPPLKFSLLHATAAQRAEAFLRTFGKWRDA